MVTEGKEGRQAKENREREREWEGTLGLKDIIKVTARGQLA